MTLNELADRIEEDGLGHVDDPRYCALIVDALRSHAANEEARKLKDALDWLWKQDCGSIDTLYSYSGGFRAQCAGHFDEDGCDSATPLEAILALKAIVEPPAPPEHVHDYEMQYVCEDCGERKAVPTPMSGSEPLASPKHEHVWDDRTWGLTRSEQGVRYIRYCQDTPCPGNASQYADRLMPAPGEPDSTYRPTIGPHHAGPVTIPTSPRPSWSPSA